MFVNKLDSDVDNLLSCLIWSHGLATGWSDFDDIIINASGVVDCIKNGITLCCSHKKHRIGPIGFFLQGSVKVASSRDLRSKKLCDGRTFSGEYYVPLDLTSLSDDCHCEVIMIPKKMCGVWVNYCARSYHGIANKMANNFRIKLYYVKPRKGSPCSKLCSINNAKKFILIHANRPTK